MFKNKVLFLTLGLCEILKLFVFQVIITKSSLSYVWLGCPFRCITCTAMWKSASGDRAHLWWLGCAFLIWKASQKPQLPQGDLCSHLLSGGSLLPALTLVGKRPTREGLPLCCPLAENQVGESNTQGKAMIRWFRPISLDLETKFSPSILCIFPWPYFSLYLSSKI